MNRLPFALALCLLASTALAAPRYKVTNLGTLPGYGESYATCLNDKGQVAGYLTLKSVQISDTDLPGNARAFLWNGRRMRLLPTPLLPKLSPPDSLDGLYDGVASSINNHGQVVGTLATYFSGAWSGTDLTAVLWHHGKIHTIPVPTGGGDTTATAINDAGQVAGTTYLTYPSYSSPRHIYFYNAGQSHDLGPGSAMSINAAGQVCGYVLLDKNSNPTSGDGDDQPFAQAQAILCTGVNGQRLTLGTGYALNLNRSGSVVGMRQSLIDVYPTPSLRTQIADALAHQKAKAILWRTGQGRSRAVPLLFHWVPQGINDKGQMVGGHWLWHNGRSDDLNTLLPVRSGWTVAQAAAINNKGQIAGYGKYHGKTRAFLLTPQRRGKHL